MNRKTLETLTESVFYVLVTLLRQTRRGTKIAEYIFAVIQSQVRLGPGAFYIILAELEEVRLIRETVVEGRKRTYALADAGPEHYEEELVRLRSCLADAEEGGRAMGYKTEDGAQTMPS